MAWRRSAPIDIIRAWSASPHDVAASARGVFATGQTHVIMDRAISGECNGAKRRPLRDDDPRRGSSGQEREKIRNARASVGGFTDTATVGYIGLACLRVNWLRVTLCDAGSLFLLSAEK